MTKLTEGLNRQLIQLFDANVMKDEAQNTWFTGQDLAEDAELLKGQLMHLNLQTGAHVLINLENSVIYTVLEQALWEIGAIVHPISAGVPVAELQAKFNQENYAMLVTQDDLANQIVNYALFERINMSLKTKAELPIFINERLLNDRSSFDMNDVNENDLALVLQTSGTTGKPKRVGLTHAMLFNAANHNITAQKLTSKDTTMVVMPMFHINAQVISILSTRLSGGKLVIAPKFSASRFWNQISQNRVSWISVVPTIVSILLLNTEAGEQFDDLKNEIQLRFVRCASFALPENKLNAFQSRFGAPVIQGYWMTETAIVITLNPFDAPKVGSAGKAIGTEVAILVDDQLQGADTEQGEILVRGDHVIGDYLESRHGTFHQNWLKTGDIGYIDAEGYLFIEGRSKDMINRGGEKIAHVLSQIDSGKDVAVIGLPDDLYGEAVTAVVEKKASEQSEFTLTKMILDYAKKHLAKFEQPTRIFFVEKFPRNPTGKIKREELKKQLALTV